MTGVGPRTFLYTLPMKSWCFFFHFISNRFVFGLLGIFSTLIVHAQTESCRIHQISESYLKNNFNVATAYKPIFKSCYLDEGHTAVTAIRLLELLKKKYVLYVNNKDLTTDLIPESCLRQCSDSLVGIRDEQNNSNYYNALQKTTMSPFPLHGDGLKHELSSERQVFLTIDLCPSHLPLDQELFQKIQKNQINKMSLKGIKMSNNYFFTQNERV